MRRALVVVSLVLVVGGSSGDAATVGYGISATAPHGWRLRVLRGALEAATVPLPPVRWRSHGVRLGDALRSGDLSVLLFENAPSWNVPFEYAVYRRGPPLPLSARDFRPALGGSNSEGHAFARRNFTVAGRYFDLFVESGSTRPAPRRIAELNTLLRSLTVRPGDFYPGHAPPARFRPARGWTTLHSRTIPVGPSTYSVTVASTVRYRNALNQFPPHETLERLPPNGIVISLRLSADNRDPPTAARRGTRRPVLQIGAATCGSFEGAPSTVLTCRVEAQRFREYVIFGWVIFGRRNPTAEQRVRARAELDRLELPVWPLWPVS